MEYIIGQKHERNLDFEYFCNLDIKENPIEIDNKDRELMDNNHYQELVNSYENNTRLVM